MEVQPLGCTCTDEVFTGGKVDRFSVGRNRYLSRLDAKYGGYK